MRGRREAPVIAAGSIIRSKWGDRMEVTGVDPSGQLWCRADDTPPHARRLVPLGAIGHTHHLEPAPAPPPRTVPAPLLALGAMRPGGSYWSVPSEETSYWRPCFSPAAEGGSHCWFIASNLELSLWCPTCRPARIRISDAAPLTTVPVTPWGAAPAAWADEPDAAAWREDYEERAAILQYLGNLPRRAAEAEAYRLIRIKLTNTRAPRGAQLSLVA
jgi:hypothetical protein